MQDQQLTLTVTDGTVSGRAGDFIKLSAKLDQGNSGGAVFNSLGELVGIPTAGVFGASEWLAYALGTDSIEYWLDWLGIEETESAAGASSAGWSTYNLEMGITAKFPTKPKYSEVNGVNAYIADDDTFLYAVSFSEPLDTAAREDFISTIRQTDEVLNVGRTEAGTFVKWTGTTDEGNPFINMTFFLNSGTLMHIVSARPGVASGAALDAAFAEFVAGVEAT